MRFRLVSVMAAVALLGSVALVSRLSRGDTATSGTAAKMVVSLQGKEGKQLPEITPENVVVMQGKDRLRVTKWAPAKDDGLALFIAIDDAVDPRVGGLLGDVRSFIQAQPSTTLVGVAYLSNNVARIAQDLTNDHDKAAQALRMPTGNVGTGGNPYLALTDLIKRWPEHGGRKEIIVISDGIDRFRRASSRMAVMAPPTDATTLIRAAQRAGILIHAIYAEGAGRIARNSWELSGGQNGLSQVADETGGESFMLGYQNPVSFRPYLDRLQIVLNNQYWLAFELKPGTKSGLQPIDTSTEVSGAEIVSANNVYVPTGK